MGVFRMLLQAVDTDEWRDSTVFERIECHRAKEKNSYGYYVYYFIATTRIDVTKSDRKQLLPEFSRGNLSSGGMVYTFPKEETVRAGVPTRLVFLNGDPDRDEEWETVSVRSGSEGNVRKNIRIIIDE